MYDYQRCKVCSFQFDEKRLESNNYICPNCGYYLPFDSRKRIQALSDNGMFKEYEIDTEYFERINDYKYKKEIKDIQKRIGLSEAIVCGEIRIMGILALIGVMDNRFMMASMGYVVGESICRLFKRAIKKHLPVILFCCSGGARMQEGIISLMQMEKTAAIVKRHSDAGLLYISVLTNPTMGGVMASFAMLADIILAEKGARVGFAGTRVIEQNTGEKLPDGFQSAERQKERGFIDAVVNRNEIKDILAFVLKLHQEKNPLKLISLRRFEKKKIFEKRKTMVTPWEQVKIARGANRPTSLDYISTLFPDFFELSGDRIDGDDHAVVAGLASFCNVPITVIGQQKGKKNIQDALYRNFGMPSPSGYRKALRLAKQAEKFGRPIVFFVDTIGAACGTEAESKGQGLAIAKMLYEMSTISVPVYSVIIGEGGSGGALAFAVGNVVDILENAVYSIITPEGYASILWKDSTKAAEVAGRLKLTSSDLYELHIVNSVIPEHTPVTIEDMDQVCSDISKSLYTFLVDNRMKSKRAFVKERFDRFNQY